MVPLIATGPEVYFATMTTVLSNYYDSLVDTLNHIKSLKLKDHPGGNVKDCCNEILVDADHLGSARAFKPTHLGYITRIFEDTSDSRFHIWSTHNYKEVMEFVKKPFVCDEDVMQTDDISTYGFLVPENLQEYNNIVDSKWLEPNYSKNDSKDDYLILMASTAAIEHPVNKNVDKAYCKIRHKGK